MSMKVPVSHVLSGKNKNQHPFKLQYMRNFEILRNGNDCVAVPIPLSLFPFRIIKYFSTTMFPHWSTYR